jgi:hypothetical protein
MNFIVHFAGEEQGQWKEEIEAASHEAAEKWAENEAKGNPDCTGWLVEQEKQDPNPFQYGDIPFFGE